MKNYVYLCPVEKQLTTFAHENNLAFRDTPAVRGHSLRVRPEPEMPLT